MSVCDIGCCGAYCKTCMQWQKTSYPNEHTCLGCKLGYDTGKRDIAKARCEIKVCCFGRHKLETCADCNEYPCQILTRFWGKNGWKYQQYKKQLEFIRQNGYDAFLKCTETWKRAHGKLLAP